jgi:hypothetical protein
MFRYRLDSIFDPEIDFMEVRRKTSSEEAGSSAGTSLQHVLKEAISETDWNLVWNWRFLLAAIFCALIVVVFPNFPLILSSHLLALDKRRLEANATTLDMTRISEGDRGFLNVESTLIVIYIADGVSRLSMGYFSDYSIFNRKTAFSLSSLVGGFLIIGNLMAEVIH